MTGGRSTVLWRCCLNVTDLETVVQLQKMVYCRAIENGL